MTTVMQVKPKTYIFKRPRRKKLLSNIYFWHFSFLQQKQKNYATSANVNPVFLDWNCTSDCFEVVSLNARRITKCTTSLEYPSSEQVANQHKHHCIEFVLKRWCNSTDLRSLIAAVEQELRRRETSSLCHLSRKCHLHKAPACSWAWHDQKILANERWKTGDLWHLKKSTMRAGRGFLHRGVCGRNHRPAAFYRDRVY